MNCSRSIPVSVSDTSFFYPPPAFGLQTGSVFRLQVFLLLLVLLLSSCASLREPEFRAVENIRVARITREKGTLLLDVRYFNPNKTRAMLKEASGRAWLDGNFLGHFRVDTIVRIGGYSEFTLPVALDVDMKKLFRNSLTAFLNKESTLKLDGNSRLGKGLLTINYPIRYEGKQDWGKWIGRE